MSKKKKGESDAHSEVGDHPLARLQPAWIDFHLGTVGPAIAHWKRENKIPQTLLMTGIEGCGIVELSYWIAQFILCESFSVPGSPPKPCAACASCVRARDHQWLDLVEIAPERDEDGEESGSLKVDQFRALKESQGFGGYASAFRVILIRRADRMTPQAANSILKIIEEPPPGWIFLLTAPDPQSLIPTILSRCQKLTLRPLPDSLLFEQATRLGLSTTQAKRIVPLAQGSAVRLQDFSEADVIAKLDLIDQTWERPQSSTLELIEWGAQSPKNLALMLDALEQQCLKSLDTPSTAPRGEPQTPQRKRTLILSERLPRARALQNTPINKKLLIQELLLSTF